jgi:hypothetical protein
MSRRQHAVIDLRQYALSRPRLYLGFIPHLGGQRLAPRALGKVVTDDRRVSHAKFLHRRGRVPLIGAMLPQIPSSKLVAVVMMPRLEQAAPAAQPGAPTLATALRRLAEHALSGTSTRQRSGGSKRKAAKMAEKAIDHLVDQAATGEEHAQRKRRLIKGPREFRDLRRDKSKTKAHRRRSPAYISRRSRAGERPQSERGAAHCSEHRKAAGAASQIGMKDEKMPRCERGKAKGGTAGDITPTRTQYRGPL